MVLREDYHGLEIRRAESGEVGMLDVLTEGQASGGPVYVLADEPISFVSAKSMRQHEDEKEWPEPSSFGKHLR